MRGHLQCNHTVSAFARLRHSVEIGAQDVEFDVVPCDVESDCVRNHGGDGDKSNIEVTPCAARLTSLIGDIDAHIVTVMEFLRLHSELLVGRWSEGEEELSLLIERGDATRDSL